MPSHKKIVTSGDKYGLVTLTGNTKSVNSNLVVEYICVCKNIGWTRLNRLTSGYTKSCGCLAKETARKLLTKHGLCKHPLYSVWGGMIERCTKENHPYYKKGVRVCDEWKTFQSFYDWAITNGWKKGLQLDKDKKATNQEGKLYSPEFCSFLTSDENNQYREFHKIMVEYKSETKPLYKWCKELNLDYSLMKGRILKGWTMEKAITFKVIEAPFFTYKNESKRLYEWCNLLGVSYKTIRGRLSRNWDFAKAIEEPIKGKYAITF